MSAKDLYSRIASRYGVSSEEIRREIQSAITEAYTNPHKNTKTAKAQSRIPHQDSIPTPEEVISYLYGQLLKEAKEVKNL